VSVVAESDGVTTEYPAEHVVSSMPFSLLLKAMDPPVPAEVQQAADDLAFRDFLSIALVVPADKVPWRTTGSTSTLPRSRRCGCRTSARGRRSGQGRPQRPRPRVHGARGRRVVDRHRRGARRAGQGELETIGLLQAGDVEAGYVGAHAQGLSGLRRTYYQANVEVLRSG
jgi:hypothetical protein